MDAVPGCMNPGKIEDIDRFLFAPRVKGLAKTDLTRELVPISYIVVKVSGH